MFDSRSFVVGSAIILCTTFAGAKGSNDHSNSISPGIGSSQSSTPVHGHTKKDGTYAEPHQHSTPDKKFENYWTPKGNENPHTRQDGAQMSEPAIK